MNVTRLQANASASVCADVDLSIDMLTQMHSQALALDVLEACRLTAFGWLAQDITQMSPFGGFKHHLEHGICTYLIMICKSAKRWCVSFQAFC